MRLIFMCLIFLVHNGLCERDRPYINFKLGKITAKDTETLNRILEKLRNIDDLSRDHTDNSVVIVTSPDDVGAVTSVVAGEKAKFEILQDNLQESIDEEFHHYDMRRRKRQAVTLEDAIKEFLTLEEIYDFQDRIVSSCKHLTNVEKQTIGYSDDNQPINVVKISQHGSANKKTIFIEAGIHAREWLSPATANYITYHLACNSENTDMLDLFNWEIVPVVNPDGYRFTHKGNRLWRKNRQPNGRSRCIGTDLNRNFGSGYGKSGASNNVCSDTYRGLYAYSAPEAKALRDYVMNINNDIISYISIHTYGQYILLPWSHNATRPSDYASLVAHAKRAEAAMKLRFKIGSGYTTIYPASGVSADFARETASIARSYTWELMPNKGTRNGFAPRESRVPVYTPIIWRGLRVYAQSVADEIAAILEESVTGTTIGSSTDNMLSTTSSTAVPDTRPDYINPFLWNALQKYTYYSWYPALLQQLEQQNG